MSSRTVSKSEHAQAIPDETRSFSWRSYGAKKVALFQTHGSVVILQHVRTSYANEARASRRARLTPTRAFRTSTTAY